MYTVSGHTYPLYPPQRASWLTCICAHPQVFNRSLNASEVIALSAQLGESWHVSAKDSTCDENRLKPGTPPTHRCTGTETTLAGAGPSNATIARLTKFVAATSEPSLHVSAKLVYI